MTCHPLCGTTDIIGSQFLCSDECFMTALQETGPKHLVFGPNENCDPDCPHPDHWKTCGRCGHTAHDHAVEGGASCWALGDDPVTALPACHCSWYVTADES